MVREEVYIPNPSGLFKNEDPHFYYGQKYMWPGFVAPLKSELRDSMYPPLDEIHLHSQLPSMSDAEAAVRSIFHCAVNSARYAEAASKNPEKVAHFERLIASQEAARNAVLAKFISIESIFPPH